MDVIILGKDEWVKILDYLDCGDEIGGFLEVFWDMIDLFIDCIELNVCFVVDVVYEIKNLFILL